jgi:hypothetical protein
VAGTQQCFLLTNQTGLAPQLFSSQIGFCGPVTLILLDLFVHWTKRSTNSLQRPAVVTKLITRKQTSIVSLIKWQARWTSGSALRRFLLLRNADGLWILFWSRRRRFSLHLLHELHQECVDWNSLLRAWLVHESNPVGGEYFQTSLDFHCIHPASCTVDTGCHSRGLERLGRGVYHPPQSIAEFKERTQLFQHFTVWYLLTCSKAIFTFTLLLCIRMSAIL